jgi:hypothetical protein
MVLLEPTILSQPKQGRVRPMRNVLTDKLKKTCAFYRTGAFYAVGRLTFVQKTVTGLLFEGGGVLLGMYAMS